MSTPSQDGVADLLIPTSRRELVDLLRSDQPPLQVVGAGTKKRRVTGKVLTTRGLNTILEPSPGEFTVRVSSGVEARDLEAALAEHGQFLPFEPLLVGAGATIGGTVAAAANGPGRLLYGGVRDFILAIEMVDGTGRKIRGGAPVVKNAAGFDLPKLVVGSRSRLGVLVEITLKVFPRPQAAWTVCLEADDLATLQAAQEKAASSPIQLAALELSCGRRTPRLGVRMAGQARALEHRCAKLEESWAELGGTKSTVLRGDSDRSFWSQHRELDWAGTLEVIKLVAPTARLRTLNQELAGWSSGGPARSLSEGQLLVAISETDRAGLLQCSEQLEVPWLTLRQSADPVQGSEAEPYEARLTGALYSKARSVLDPASRLSPS